MLREGGGKRCSNFQKASSTSRLLSLDSNDAKGRRRRKRRKRRLPKCKDDLRLLSLSVFQGDDEDMKHQQQGDGWCLLLLWLRLFINMNGENQTSFAVIQGRGRKRENALLFSTARCSSLSLSLSC